MPKILNKPICCLCGEHSTDEKKVEFYKSNSGLYKNKLLPICKDCFARKFSQYSQMYLSNKKAMQRLCMAFDIYFNEKVFDKCDTNDDTVIGNYFRMLNMSQNKGKTFEDSINEGLFNLSGDRRPDVGHRTVVVDEYGNEVDEEVDKELVKKWGTGFSKAEYDYLNSHYEWLKEKNPRADNSQELFINTLCYTYMKSMMALRDNDMKLYKDMQELYMKQFKESGIKTVEEVNTDGDSWGTWVEQISQYTPEEIYRNKKRYCDFDGFDDYMKRNVIRPRDNIINGTEIRDDEFYVHDEDEE